MKVLGQERSYLAGYTDAEGCISIATFKRGAARYWFSFVCFGQTQPAVVERLHTLYGGSLHVRKRGRRRRQKELRLQAIGEVRRFLLDVVPYLREKRAQAKVVLESFDPKAGDTTNFSLRTRLIRLKAKRLGAVAITRRLAITPQKHKKCAECDARAFSRGYCAKHYQKAKREGRIATNPKGAGVPFTCGRSLRAFDASYFAGYFDGDGSLAIRREGKRWYPRIAFAQTQPDTLIELHAVYGGSLTVGKAKGRRRRTLHYQLTQREAVFAMLRNIQPFVVEKRDQVELFLAKYRSNMRLTDGTRLKAQLSRMKRRTFR